MDFWYRMQATGLVLLTLSAPLLTSSCAFPARATNNREHPLVLHEPTTVSSGPVSLVVGTNRWREQGGLMEEIFFPVAVTVRNHGERTVCGGATTAVLHDSTGVSSSAVLPADVVARLFGPLASLGPLSRGQIGMATFTDGSSSLLLIRGSHSGHAGGSTLGGRGFSGGMSRLRPWYPSPFYSPFSSPFVPYFPRPFSPFSYAFPPLFPPLPYGYGPALPYGYGYVPPPAPDIPLPKGDQGPEVDQALIKEVFASAFASRALTPQEDRSGFLFFPPPSSQKGAFTLTWDWYDCSSGELVAHLSIPVQSAKPV
jgi:hypothetical protein